MSEWTKEWPKVDGQYWVRVPDDHGFDEVVEIEGELAWMQGQIDPCKASTLADYVFLGPINPADTQRAVRLAVALTDAQNAIRSLPLEALGRDPAEGYFYRDQLLVKIGAALEGK